MRLACVEVGGSSTQTVLFPDAVIVDGAQQPDGAALAIAVPGLLEGSRVRAASNLGWYDVDPVEELGLRGPAVVVCNDAEAAALGEAALRDCDALVYVGLGTGIGGALVRDGAVVASNLFGHDTGFGSALCRCGKRGCLETVAAGWALPTPLGDDEVARVADAVLRAVDGHEGPLVVGGGLARAYPRLVERMDAEGSLAPAGAKSAAAWGLRACV